MKTRNDGVFTMEPQTKGDLVSIKIIYNSGVSDQYQRVSFGDAVKLIAQYRKILDNGRKYKCHFIQASSSITLDLRDVSKIEATTADVKRLEQAIEDYTGY